MRGEVFFEAQGRQCALRYTTNALVRLEEAAGESVMSLAASLGDGSVSIASVRLMFWAGLAQGVTLESAGDMMDELGFERTGELIGAAFEAAFPSEDGDEKKTTATAA